jgi:hypothetical protein
LSNIPEPDDPVSGNFGAAEARTSDMATGLAG